MDRLKTQLPYVVVLLVAGYLFYLATQFNFSAPRGRIGPDVWPKAILGLAMLTCVYEIVKNLLFRDKREEIRGVLDTIVEEAPEGKAPVDEEAPLPARRSAFPHLLIAGIAMTIAYAVLVETLGFFVCTVLFLVGFTWVGRYRRPGVVVTASVLGALAFAFVFVKIVYVSLPLGVGPFKLVSTQLMQLLGVR
jgi:putative tricarboxylic transport membrane protein